MVWKRSAGDFWPRKARGQRADKAPLNKAPLNKRPLNKRPEKKRPENVLADAAPRRLVSSVGQNRLPQGGPQGGAGLQSEARPLETAPFPAKRGPAVVQNFCEAVEEPRRGPLSRATRTTAPWREAGVTFSTAFLTVCKAGARVLLRLCQSPTARSFGRRWTAKWTPRKHVDKVGLQVGLQVVPKVE